MSVLQTVRVVANMRCVVKGAGVWLDEARSAAGVVSGVVVWPGARMCV